MSDISKCTGDGCPSKESCYRYTAPSHPFWQSYAAFYKLIEEDACAYYVNNKENSND